VEFLNVTPQTTAEYIEETEQWFTKYLPISNSCFMSQLYINFYTCTRNISLNSTVILGSKTWQGNKKMRKSKFSPKSQVILNSAASVLYFTGTQFE
jgi:hypothetical protein